MSKRNLSSSEDEEVQDQESPDNGDSDLDFDPSSGNNEGDRLHPPSHRVTRSRSARDGGPAQGESGSGGRDEAVADNTSGAPHPDDHRVRIKRQHRSLDGFTSHMYLLILATLTLIVGPQRGS